MVICKGPFSVVWFSWYEMAKITSSTSDWWWFQDLGHVSLCQGRFGRDKVGPQLGYDFDPTKKRWPSKKRHRCVDDTQWCVSHWGSHLTGLAALNEGAFHVLQPEERDTFGLMGDWGEMKGPKQKNTEMFEEEEDFWSLITWTVLEVRPEKDKCKLRKIDGRKAHHNRIFHKFTAPFLDFFQLAIFRRRSHKFSACASSHSWFLHISSLQPFVNNMKSKTFLTSNGWREELLNSSGGLNWKYF